MVALDLGAAAAAIGKAQVDRVMLWPQLTRLHRGNARFIAKSVVAEQHGSDQSKRDADCQGYQHPQSTPARGAAAPLAQATANRKPVRQGAHGEDGGDYIDRDDDDVQGDGCQSNWETLLLTFTPR